MRRVPGAGKGQGGGRGGAALKWALPFLIVAAAAAAWFLLGQKAKPSYKATPIPVRIERPIKGDLSRALRLSGHIESESMVTLLPLVAGTLQDVTAGVGDFVRKGQVVAHVDSERYRLQEEQAKAAYLAAKSTFERLDQLYRAGATTQQNFDQAKGQYEAYLSQYQLAKVQLEYADVKSPIDGVVLIRHLESGSLASPERPLMTIGDLGRLIVKAKVPERHYELFTGPSLPSIRLSRPTGESHPATIKSVSPFVSADSKNFEVVVAIGGNIGRLRPGMFVNLEFELARWPGVYSLPFAALASGQRLWWVDGGLAHSAEYNPTQSSDERFVVPPEWADRDFVVEGGYFLSELSPVLALNGAKE